MSEQRNAHMAHASNGCRATQVGQESPIPARPDKEEGEALMPTRIVKTDFEYGGEPVARILSSHPTRQPYLIRQGITTMFLVELLSGDQVWMLEDELETY